MAGTDNIPVDIEFLFKSLNAEKEAQRLKKEISDVGATTDKVSEQVEANFTEAFVKARSEAAKTNAAYSKGAAGAAMFAKGNQQLSYSMQQVARELPSLAISPQMFFLAISNNLPILQDQIRKTRIENEALKKSGVTTVPVWQQLVSSLFSWQTALVAGITIITVYAKKIGNAVAKLFNLRNETKLTGQEINKLTDALSENMGSELGKMNRLFDNLTKAKEGTRDFYEAKKEIIEQYGSYLSGLDNEITSLRDIEGAYRAVTKAIIEQAKAKALNSVYEDQGQKLIAETTGQYKIIRDEFIRKFGEKAGQIQFSQFRKEFESGKGLSKEMQNIVASFTHSITSTAGTSISGYIQQYEQDINKVDEAIKNITKAQEGFNSKVKEARDLLDKVYTPSREQTTDLIKQKELELEQIRLRPATTKKELVDRNKAIAAIEQEIQALRTLGIENDNLRLQSDYKKQLEAKEQEYLSYNAALRQYGKEWADAHYELLLKDGANFKEYLENQVAQYKDSREKMIAIAAMAQNAGISLFQNELKPIKTKQSTGVQVTGTKLDTKQLADLTGWYEKLEKRLTKLQGTNMQQALETTIQIFSYVSQITDQYAEQLELTEEQQEALRGGFDAMAGMARIATGDIVGGTAQLVSSATELFHIAPEKLSEQYEALHTQINEVINAANVAKESLGSIGASNGSLYAIARMQSELLGLIDDAERLQQKVDENARYGRTGDKEGTNFMRSGYVAVRNQIEQLNGIIQALSEEALLSGLNPESQKAINELLSSYNNLVSEMDAITQNVIGSSISELSQSLADAFLNGQDAAEAWGNTVNDIISNIVRNKLISELLTKPVTDAVDKLITDLYDSDFVGDPRDGITQNIGLNDDELSSFVANMNAIYEQVAPAFQQAIDALSETGIEIKKNSGYNELQGITRSITEETGSLLVGQFMSIRTDVKSILAAVAQDDEIVQRRLAYLKTIASNTAHNARLVNIEQELKTMNKILESKL